MWRLVCRSWRRGGCADGGCSCRGCGGRWETLGTGMQAAGTRVRGSGCPGAGEGPLGEEGAVRPSQWGGGGSRSGLMSKSMPFLGASIFLKDTSLSEGGFPVPSESASLAAESEGPEGGACGQKEGAVEPELCLWGAPRFPSPSRVVRSAPHTCLWLPSHAQKGAPRRVAFPA